MNRRGCRQSILVPRARRFLVTWSGNEGLPLVGYKLSRVALGTKMVSAEVPSSSRLILEDRRRLCSQGIGLGLCHLCTTFLHPVLGCAFKNSSGTHL